MAPLVVGLFLTGCATDAGPNVARPRSTDRLTRLVSNDDGLELRQWAIAADPTHVAQVLAGFADGAAAGPDVIERLDRNGLSLVRVPRSDLRALRDALGVAALNLTAWHGQVYEWREAIQRPLGPGPTAIAVDGHVRRYEAGGAVRLMMRAWTMPMEEGPYLSLELAPVHERPQPQLERLLGADGLRGTDRLGEHVELALTPGHAWVLTEAVSIEKPDADATPTDTPRGPAAPTPLTVGGLLFASDGERPTSGLLVFVPEIARPELEEAVTERRAEGPP
ncbi:MAG: hypothetical protein ACYS0D_12610 [Planctomycetota bacterium]|jgi:hypothetical protein